MQSNNNNQEHDMNSASTTTDTGGTEYRGFYSSIAHQFRSLDTERVDACALMCCGILQSDRDRYLLTGIRPPTWTRRFVLHIFTPVALFLTAGYAAFNIRNAYLNQLLCTLLVGFLAVTLIMQCYKGRWKRMGVRKELLWRKYQLRHGEDDDDAGSGPPREEDEEWGDRTYLQGQTAWDLSCAHTFVGCYSQDKPKDNVHDAHLRNNLLSCLWKYYSQCCCLKLCRCHLQVCGMCGLAQEARELERMVPANRRRIDYCTMQPWHEYYPTLLMLRAKDTATSHGATLTTHVKGLSQLSKQLLQLFAIVLVFLLVLAIVLRYSLAHVGVFLLVFFHAWLLLWLVHWPYHRTDLSVDNVIKAFSCGFVLVPTMVVAWEALIGMVLTLIMAIIMAISGVNIAHNDDGYNAWSSFGLPGGFAPLAAGWNQEKDYLVNWGHDHKIIYSIYLLLTAYVLAAGVEEISKYLGYRMVSDHPDFWTRGELEKAVEATERDQALESTEGASKGQSTQTGSSQEKESTKPTVPLRDLPVQYQDRSRRSRGAAITVTMVAVALGFGSAENLMHIFIYNENTLQMELTVLLVRMLFPIHAICAAIQSIGVCKRDVERQPNNELGRVLLPAMLLHGSFDYIILLLGFLNRNNTASVAYVTIGLSFFLELSGLAYFFFRRRAQLKRFDTLDQNNVDRSELL